MHRRGLGGLHVEWNGYTGVGGGENEASLSTWWWHGQVLGGLATASASSLHQVQIQERQPSHRHCVRSLSTSESVTALTHLPASPAVAVFTLLSFFRLVVRLVDASGRRASCHVTCRLPFFRLRLTLSGSCPLYFSPHETKTKFRIS